MIGIRLLYGEKKNTFKKEVVFTETKPESTSPSGDCDKWQFFFS